MSIVIRALFFLGDLVLLNIAVSLSFYLSGSGSPYIDEVYLLIFSNLAWLYLSLVSNPYNLNKAWSLSKAIKTQLSFFFIHILVVASLIFFLGKHYAVYQIGYIYLMFIPLFFLWKIGTFYLRKVFTPELLTKNYILVGHNAISSEIRKYYLSNPDLGYRFLGYIDLSTGGEELVKRIRNLSTSNEIHEIYCCSPQLSNNALKPLIDFGLDSLIKVKVVVDSVATHQQTIKLDRFDQELGQNVAIIPLDGTRNQFVKRVFDLIFSFIFIVLVMSWLLPIIALLIKIDSKGPVFFIQPRSGKYNKSFNCFKFRTMKVNTEANSIQATKDDPRITKLGSFLRRSSIDELPQFFNVFIGNMSIIGPRPHMLKHTEEYSKLVGQFMARHYVKPGITGLAQCLGYRGETKDVVDMENRVRMDRYYIENWTFWLDIKIVFMTVVSLIRGSDKAF